MVDAVTIAIGVFVVLVLGGIVVFGVSVYNRLVRLEERVKNAWSDIDVLLKQRRDALTKLIDTAKQTMEYEQETFQQIVEAREAAQRANTPREEAQADAQIRQALGDFNFRSEDHPELTATENMQDLQDEIVNLEEQIADRREYYNEAVTSYNTVIKQIPYVLLAGPLGHSEKELFEVPEAEREDVDVGAMFDDSGAGGADQPAA